MQREEKRAKMTPDGWAGTANSLSEGGFKDDKMSYQSAVSAWVSAPARVHDRTTRTRVAMQAIRRCGRGAQKIRMEAARRATRKGVRQRGFWKGHLSSQRAHRLRSQ